MTLTGTFFKGKKQIAQEIAGISLATLSEKKLSLPLYILVATKQTMSVYPTPLKLLLYVN
jgi:hypothetical protein